MDSERFEATYEKLKQARDELQVKLDLGQKEAQNAWEDLQDDWRRLEEHVEKLRDQTEEAGENIGQEARELVADVGDAISKLRDRFA